MSPSQRRLLFLPGMQLRVVAWIVAGCLTATALELLVVSWRLAELAKSAPPEVDRSLTMVLGPALLSSALWLLAITVAVALVVGVRATHRIAGPVYRISKHLRAVAGGERVQAVTLREGDELQGLCDAVNRAVQGAQQGSQEAAPLRRSA